ncbi:MAG TPA: SOS response-associated peptidase family protein, partial [Candidatus Binataceae bacterium]|nr:SOS response-associated peptidase family protein [Candidatus Binataceae bacterium]
WYPAPNQPELTFTIITCPPNNLIASIPNRMPVILSEGAAEDWMNRREPDPRSLSRLLIPAPVDLLAIQSASPLANSVKNDGPELLDATPAPFKLE